MLEQLFAKLNQKQTLIKKLTGSDQMANRSSTMRHLARPVVMLTCQLTAEL